MNPRKFWIILVVTTVLLTAGMGWLIHREMENIKQAREEVATLRTNIESSRKLIEGTRKLEDEVIVLREIATVIKQILPDQEDVNNFIKQLNEFARDAGMATTAFRKKQDNRSSREKGDFEKVAYTLSLEGDVFQFLSMLDNLETHKRFIAVPAFKMTAANRREVEEDGVARHRIQLDVETYKYAPNTSVTPVRIEGYDRKRDLLAGEVNRRRAALSLANYDYRGPRGRRDPWIDPRVPAEDGSTVRLPVAEQQAIIDVYVERVAESQAMWTEVLDAPDVLKRMVARQDLAELLATLDEDLRRLSSEGLITYVPALKRLDKEVHEPLALLRQELENSVDVLGPPREVLAGVRDGMRSHLENGEHALALEAFGTVKNDLESVRGDSVRELLAEEISQLGEDAMILRDFDQIQLTVGGVALIEGALPTVLINERPLTVGDMVNEELEIYDIRSSEIDFIFRGVILTRVF